MPDLHFFQNYSSGTAWLSDLGDVGTPPPKTTPEHLNGEDESGDIPFGGKTDGTLESESDPDDD